MLLHYTLVSPWALILHAVISLLIWYYCHVRYASLNHKHAITKIQLKQNVFYLRDKSGQEMPAYLLKHSVISPRFCLLYFRLLQEHSFPGIRNIRMVIIFPGFFNLHYNSLNIDELRRLRMFALHGKQQTNPLIEELLD